MVSTSKHDIYFLIALNASEESTLEEIVWESKKWKCEESLVLKVFRDLIQDGTVLLYELVDGECSDFPMEHCLKSVEVWAGLKRNDYMLFLTEAGEKRWEVDDWNITTKRAQELMFGGNGRVTRV